MIWRVTGLPPTSPVDKDDLSRSPIHLVNGGPLISVLIMPPKPIQAILTHKGRPHPGVPTIALIDTGASLTGATPSVIQRANLRFTGFSPLQSALGSQERRVYFGEIHFPWGAHMAAPIAECELDGLPFECIIGRDTMKNWVMIYDGIAGIVTITD